MPFEPFPRLWWTVRQSSRHRSVIIHVDTNNGWAFGNSVELFTRVQCDFAPVVTGFRMTFTDTAKIQGRDPGNHILD
jgi:hypothetical protein